MGLLDAFVIQGPNGSHRCLVLELMGPNMPYMLSENEKYAVIEPPTSSGDEESGDEHRFPYSMAKEIARQALLGLGYLHSRGINHGGQSCFRCHSRSLLLLYPLVGVQKVYTIN